MLVIPEEQSKAEFPKDLSPVRSNTVIFSLIILPVGVFNFLFELLEDDDNDDGLVEATVTSLSNVCTNFFFRDNERETL